MTNFLIMEPGKVVVGIEKFFSVIANDNKFVSYFENMACTS